jgi:hypothetical protein
VRLRTVRNHEGRALRQTAIPFEARRRRHYQSVVDRRPRRRARCALLPCFERRAELMTKTDALLYAADRIRVNSIHPGFIGTPMVEGYLLGAGDVQEGKKGGRLSSFNRSHGRAGRYHLGRPSTWLRTRRNLSPDWSSSSTAGIRRDESKRRRRIKANGRQLCENHPPTEPPIPLDRDQCSDARAVFL